jgi:hypothetical protein
MVKDNAYVRSNFHFSFSFLESWKSRYSQGFHGGVVNLGYVQQFFSFGFLESWKSRYVFPKGKRGFFLFSCLSSWICSPFQIFLHYWGVYIDV